jgi:hypothetical protein
MTIHKTISLLFVFLLSISHTFAKVYYVSTTGSDSNTGTITSPFATIQRAQAAVNAGDTVYIRGGNYVMTESLIAKYYSIWAYVTYLDKSGTNGNQIKYWAYPGEKPIFDYSNIKPSGYRITAFQVNGSYIHIKGLEITGVQVTITTHTQSECFENQGSNNIYEQLVMHDGQAIGFYLTKGSNNLVLNCDAFRNWDYTSETGKGGNTDGFGFHPSKGGTGNRIKGCRAWFNSDDGYDCINAYESVTFDSCWAFYNGYSTSYSSLGDGNGFKAGGYGQAPTVSGLPNPIPAHTVRFCMSYRNKSNGIYANHHVVTGSNWYNNTAYRNSTNYNMLSQRITKSSKTGADTTLDCPGFNHVLHNNVSFKYSSLRDTLNIGSTCNFTYNTFTPLSSITVDASDFVSIDESLLIAPRQANGNLPENGFLRLKPGSDLIDKGMELGFPYNGTAPDLGAFEIKTSQNITFDALAPKSPGDTPFQLTAIASSGLPVNYLSSDLSVAKISGDIVTITSPGTTVITASQPGNINYYAAADVNQTLTISSTTSIRNLNESFLIYPVPLTNKLMVKTISSVNISKIEIETCNGIKLSEITNSASPLISIDFSKYPSGIYLIKIHAQSQIICRKIVKY